MSRPVAVVGYAESSVVGGDERRNEVEILMPVLAEAIERSGIPKKEIGFTVSGSSDYLAGQPFAFVIALDAVGPWPPIVESHVEMDGAWALYEAWTRLQHGDIDSALVYAFGKSSLGDLRRTLTLQLDPYCLAPLWPDATSLAALQARALLDAGMATEDDFAAVAAARRGATINALMAEPYVASPLRPSDCAPTTDGAAAVVLAAGDLARRVCPRPAWITGIDHRIEAHALGVRDLTVSTSTSLAAAAAGVAEGPVDVAEIHAPYSPQELIVRDALGVDGNADVNPSGGCLTSNPVMVAGLVRIGEAAGRIIDGSATRAVAHATSGPCLQQNLVCVLDSDAETESRG